MMDDLVKEARRVMALPYDERRSVVRQAAPELMMALQLKQVELLEKLVMFARDQVPLAPTPDVVSADPLPTQQPPGPELMPVPDEPMPKKRTPKPRPVRSSRRHR